MQPGAGSINYYLTSTIWMLESKQSWLASFQSDHRSYSCSKEPDCWKLWWFELLLGWSIQIIPGWHPDRRFPALNCNSNFCSVCNLPVSAMSNMLWFKGRRDLSKCQSCKTTNQKNQAAFWVPICSYWIQGTVSRLISATSFQTEGKCVWHFKANHD